MSRSARIATPAWMAGWIGLPVAGAAGFLLVFVGGWVLVDALTGDGERILDDGWAFWLQLTAVFTLCVAAVLRRRAAMAETAAASMGVRTARTGTVAAVALLLVVVLAGSVRAFNPQPDPPLEVLFGIVGVTSGDIVRLNIVSVDNPNLLGDINCEGTLGFVDAGGQTVLSRAFQMQAGQGTAAEYRLPAVRGGTAHQLLRPVYEQSERGECTLVPTLEILDARTMQTRLLHPGILRGFNPQPDPPMPQA